MYPSVPVVVPNTPDDVFVTIPAVERLLKVIVPEDVIPVAPESVPEDRVAVPSVRVPPVMVDVACNEPVIPSPAFNSNWSSPVTFISVPLLLSLTASSFSKEYILIGCFSLVSAIVYIQ